MNAFTEIQLATVEKWYAAYEARDLDALCELAHPDIVLLPVVPLLSDLPGATFFGHTGLRTLMRWFFDAYPHVRIESNVFREVPPSILAATTFVIDDRSESGELDTTHNLFDVDGQGVHRMAAFVSEADALAAVASKPVLTPREREVFQLLAHGLTTPQIAERLFISLATVRTHVQNGMRRLGAHTKTQAVSMALKHREIVP
jgi:DNA-binding CsgD family transcriptional regulator